VDENVATDQEVERLGAGRRHRVPDEIVALELDQPSRQLADRDPVAVIHEIALTDRGVDRTDGAIAVASFPRLRKHVGRNVGREDLDRRRLWRKRLQRKDGERVCLLAARAGGAPDSNLVRPASAYMLEEPVP